jgi:hypothetical protein
MGSLRLFLALSVAFGHFGVPLGFPTSDIAVQSFFVISGFYMALVLNEKYGPGSYWLFISNRLSAPLANLCRGDGSLLCDRRQMASNRLNGPVQSSVLHSLANLHRWPGDILLPVR